MPMSDSIQEYLCSAFHDTIVAMMQSRLRARRPRASNKGLWPCLFHTEISPVSLKLLIMLCTVNYEMYKAFVI